MTDGVYPSAKPNGTTAPTYAAPASNPNTAHPPPSQVLPPSKPHLFNPARHPYRPTPSYLSRHNHRRCSCRRCCFLCCCWSVLFLIFILLLACIAATAVYFLYNPKRPTFSISSLKISQFNLTTTPADDSTRLTAKLNLTLSSKNPNKKVVFFYDPITIKSFSNQQVLLANGTFPGFTSTENNVTIIHTTMSMSNQVLDADSVMALKSDLKKKAGVPIKLVLETKVKVKMDKIKVRKIDIVVTCEGIHGQLPRGRVAGTAITTKAKCKVDPRFKIWKVTF